MQARNAFGGTLPPWRSRAARERQAARNNTPKNTKKKPARLTRSGREEAWVTVKNG
jgi:hypothetical protein